MSYDRFDKTKPVNVQSQSLWNRAVSYDRQWLKTIILSTKVSIPLEQGSVLRLLNSELGLITFKRLNPFGTGQCLTTKLNCSKMKQDESLNPFGTGQCLTTLESFNDLIVMSTSQSLWNRAVSYDYHILYVQKLLRLVSIPLEQGSVLRPFEHCFTNSEICVSIPLEQGSVLRHLDGYGNFKGCYVSIPLEQGSVLRHMLHKYDTFLRNRSQSLWNRAVSYDCSGVIKPCATRLTEATSQLFPRLRELGLDLAKF